MFTDPDNYNRDTERDFPTFGESSDIRKQSQKNPYPSYQNTTGFSPSFGKKKNDNLLNAIKNIKEENESKIGNNSNNNNNNNNNNNDNLENRIKITGENMTESWLEKLKCSFLQKYFDIETDEIKERLISSIIPLNSNFYNLIEPKPDLYGPFWIYTTLIFVIAASGSMTKYLQGITNEDYFQVFIPIAAYVIYGIGFCLPILIYVCMYFFGSNTSFILILCIYAYSFTIYIPVMILCIPIEKLQWAFLLIGVLHSTGFLVVNFWNELNKFVDNRKYFVIGIICIFQICLYLLLKIKFFKHIKLAMNN